MALLTNADYPAIRAAIDVSLGTAELPDAIVALDLYVGAGQREVLAIDPLAEIRSGNDLQHAKTAAILFTAARLVGALPQMLRESALDHEYERAKVDAAARAAELRALAGAELDAYLDAGDTASDRPTMFTVARGYRGRW